MQNMNVQVLVQKNLLTQPITCCAGVLRKDMLKLRRTKMEEKKIDWEQRRYELVKAAMQGFCSNPHQQIMDADSNMVAEWSIGFADSLIKKLKGD